MDVRFAAVSFQATKPGLRETAEIINYKWLTPTKNHAWWPELQGDNEAEEYMMDDVEPNTCEIPWKCWPISIYKGPFLDKMEANKRVEEFTKGLDDDSCTQTIPGKRRRRMTKRYAPPSSSVTTKNMKVIERTVSQYHAEDEIVILKDLEQAQVKKIVKPPPIFEDQKTKKRPRRRSNTAAKKLYAERDDDDVEFIPGTDSDDSDFKEKQQKKMPKDEDNIVEERKSGKMKSKLSKTKTTSRNSTSSKVSSLNKEIVKPREATTTSLRNRRTTIKIGKMTLTEAKWNHSGASVSPATSTSGTAAIKNCSVVLSQSSSDSPVNMSQKSLYGSVGKDSSLGHHEDQPATKSKVLVNQRQTPHRLGKEAAGIAIKAIMDDENLTSSGINWNTDKNYTMTSRTSGASEYSGDCDMSVKNKAEISLLSTSNVVALNQIQVQGTSSPKPVFILAECIKNVRTSIEELNNPLGTLTKAVMDLTSKVAGNEVTLVELKNMVETLQTTMTQGLSLNRGPSTFKLPISTLEELKNVEDSLDDASTRFHKECELRRKLPGIRLENLSKTCRRFMTCVITNDLAAKFNWVGIRGPKIGFATANPNLTRIILDLLKNMYDDGTLEDEDVAACIMPWFATAPSRAKSIAEDGADGDSSGQREQKHEVNEPDAASSTSSQRDKLQYKNNSDRVADDDDNTQFPSTWPSSLKQNEDEENDLQIDEENDLQIDEDKLPDITNSDDMLEDED